MFDKSNTTVNMTPINALDEIANGMIVYNKGDNGRGFGYIFKDKGTLKLLPFNHFAIELTQDFITNNELYYLSGNIVFNNNFKMPYRTISVEHTLFRLHNDDDFVYFKTSKFVEQMYNFNTIKIYVGVHDMFIGTTTNMDYTNPYMASTLLVQ